MDSTVAKYITLSSNDYVYGGTAEDLIVNYIHPLFLKANSAASWDYNPNWREATAGVFADNYWKAIKFKISTLESMGAWDIVERYESMNFVD